MKLRTDVERELEKLINYERTRSKSRLPSEVKPCIMKLLESSSLNGTEPFLIAVELHRVGKNEKQIEAILEKLKVRESEIRGAIRSSLKKEYKYSCLKLAELGLCLYEDQKLCREYDKVEDTHKHQERYFWLYGWSRKLTSSESMLYLGIREIEKLRIRRAGSWLYISFDELSKISGITRCIIGKKLIKLSEVGLIKYKAGKKRVKGSKGLASQIKRIIPIPKPK